MRKIFIILSFIFLCGTQNTAQKTITKTDFDVLVDYANCKYIMAFIEKHNKGKSNTATTNNSLIKQRLSVVSLDNPNDVLKYDELVELLSDNNTAQNLAKAINDKKSKFDEYSNDKSLINVLEAVKWVDVDLSQVSTDIQKDILLKYNLENNTEMDTVDASKNEDVKMQIDKISKDVKNMQTMLGKLQQQCDSLKKDIKIFDDQDSLKNLELVAIILGLLLVFFFITIWYIKLWKDTDKKWKNNRAKKFTFWGIKRWKNSDEKQKDSTEIYNNESGNDDERIDENITDQLQKRVESLEENTVRIKDIVRMETKDLQKQVGILENRSNDNNNGDEKLFAPVVEPVNSDVKYLNAREGIVLYKVTSKENAYYEIFDIQGKKAKYKFSGNEERALVYYDAVLKDVFDDSKSYFPNAKHINSIEAGTVIERENGKWEIQTLAKINFS
ncbi:MAG: hypothetical protein FWF52_09215 [Candidatus Azobacteroides sp.]|nr:hypothetical protein [Candidatus Azobacteroides sp.]